MAASRVGENVNCGTPTRVSVLLAHKLGMLTYAAEHPLRPGSLVAAPLGGRTLLGVVWDAPPDMEIAAERLKTVAPVPEAPSIPRELCDFADFFARYTMTAPGAVARMILPPTDALLPARAQTLISLGDPALARLTPGRQRVIDALPEHPVSPKELAEAAEVSSAVVAGMVKAGQLLKMEEAPPAPVAPDPSNARRPPLSAAQVEAANTLHDAVAAQKFAPLLLEGVTGSGKTAVYLEAVASALKAGRQALILMPEIALTPMVTARFAERFGVAAAEWHSGRSRSSRAAVWRGVADGSVKVVVGARSALFLPFQQLGAIIVDEEHDASYKQEDGVIYNARDMAIVRAKAAAIPAVLVSATPTVETRVNAANGRYGHVTLPGRQGSMALPDIATVDLTRTPPARGAWLAPASIAAVNAALEAGEQSLLFLNRRGYAPLTLCRRCGGRLECPQCDAALTEHRLRRRLLCHHCGYSAPRPTACPHCGHEDTLTPCGPGVERVAEEAAALWPAARIAVLSSDFAGGLPALSAALKAIGDGAVDIIVGTQLVAKGHTFPKLQLVVVVDADLSLGNADPRAAERTFQLLTQVTGRAGRVSAGGRALLQTHAPDHPVMAAMVRGDAEGFYAEETTMRREMGLPPYQRLAGIIVSAEDRQEALAHAAEVARQAPSDGGIEVLGPAEAPLALLRGRYRFRILVRAPRSISLQAKMAAWLDEIPIKGSVRRAVDIDPQSFL